MDLPKVKKKQDVEIAGNSRSMQDMRNHSGTMVAPQAFQFYPCTSFHIYKWTFRGFTRCHRQNLKMMDLERFPLFLIHVLAVTFTVICKRNKTQQTIV